MTDIAPESTAGLPRAATIHAAPARPTILFVSPVAEIKGGAERVLIDMLANPAVRPALAVPGEGPLAELARARGIPVRLFDLEAVATVHRPARPRDLLRAARGARRCARRLAAIAADTGASLLHTNGLKVHVIGGLVRLLYGLPVVAHLHDIPFTPVEKLIWRGIGASASRTVIVSRPCFPGRRLAGRIAVVPNGVPPMVDPPPGRTVPAVLTIGFVGRFHAFKGLHVLLDWFEHASQARPDLRLLIRGRADQEGAAYWQGLQARIAPLVDQGRCRVLGWAGPGEDPYAGIDILAVPSQTPDPAPLVILEAMQRGIPCIGYPGGGIPGLIGGPEHGALASDPAGFTAALERLLDPDAYRATSAAAATRVRACFTLEHFWTALNAQYAAAGVPAGERIQTRPH